MLDTSHPPPRRCPFFKNSFRYAVLAVAVASVTMIFANNIAFNFTVICINENSGETRREAKSSPLAIQKHFELHSNKIAKNSTTNRKRPTRGLFSDSDLNKLIAASAIGSILGAPTIIFLVNRWSFRAVVTVVGLISSVACLLTPFAASLGFLPLFLVRILQGSGYPTQLIMVTTVAEAWAPVAARDSFLLALSLYIQLGPLLVMPTAGFFCESSHVGWQPLYYLLGVCTAFCLLLFFLVFRDCPEEHPSLSRTELAQIVEGKGTRRMSRAMAIVADDASSATTTAAASTPFVIPYRQMAADPVVYVVMATLFSDFAGYVVFVQFAPTYLNKVLKISTEQTGIFSALPSLVELFVKAIAGPICTRIPAARSERLRINVFFGVAQGSMLAAFSVLGILPMLSNSLWVAQAALMLRSLGELDFVGIIKCIHIISHPYSHVLMACSSAMTNVTMLTLPLLINLLAPDNTTSQWSTVFLAIATFQTIMMIVFYVFCDSKPRPWTSSEKAELNNAQTKKLSFTLGQ